MAAKILIVALAVVCALGACEAGVTANAIISLLEKAVDKADATIKGVDETFSSTVAKALDDIDASAVSVGEGWNAQLEAIVEEATNAGLDISECALIQKVLPTVVDTVRAQSRTCLEKELTQGHADVLALEALHPKATALLAAAKEKTTTCDEQGFFGTALCLANIANDLRKEIASLTSEVSKASAAVLEDLALVAPKASACSSKYLNKGIASAMNILVSTKTCVTDLINN